MNKNKRVLVHKTDADALFLDAGAVEVLTVGTFENMAADTVVRCKGATFTLGCGSWEDAENYAAYLRGVCYGAESTGVPNMLLREAQRGGEAVLEDLDSQEELVYPCDEQGALEYIARCGAMVVDVSPYNWM